MSLFNSPGVMQQHNEGNHKEKRITFAELSFSLNKKSGRVIE
jgi:hypothetical protein